jgi:hypothetical protein
MPFEVWERGRAESTGCVNSGRRWHRRIPSLTWSISRGHFVSQEAIMSRFRARHVTPVALAALAVTFALSACALTVRRPSIQELKYNPGRYHDKTVAIDGVVTNSWGVTPLPFAMYKVDDGTGEMTVIAQDGRTPPRGARIRVKGRVNEVATFGGSSLGLHIRQTDLDFRR